MGRVTGPFGVCGVSLGLARRECGVDRVNWAWPAGSVGLTVSHWAWPAGSVGLTVWTGPGPQGVWS